MKHTKASFAETLADKFFLSRSASIKKINKIVDLFIDQLVSNHELRFIELFVLEAVERKVRPVRNIRTGESMLLAEALRVRSSVLVNADDTHAMARVTKEYLRLIAKLDISPEYFGAFLLLLRQALINKEEVIFRGFGRFKAVNVKARIVHNPSTLESLGEYPATSYMRFQAFRPLLAKLN